MFGRRKKDELIDASKISAELGKPEAEDRRKAAKKPEPVQPPMIEDLAKVDDVPDFNAWLQEAARALSEDYAITGAQEMANLPDAAYRSQMFNMQFAIYCELRRLRELAEREGQ